MNDDTMPPAGATVTDADGGRWRYTAKGWYAVGCDWGRPVADEIDSATLTALWRMQAERDQLKAEVELWRREVRDRDKTIATLHGEVQSALSERCYAQDCAQDALDRVAGLEVALREALRVNRELEDEVASDAARWLRVQRAAQGGSFAPETSTFGG